MEIQDHLKYQKAVKKVNKLKNFYTHLIVYIVINIMIYIGKIQKMEANDSYFDLEFFKLPIFWGIGLFFHAFSVFGMDFIFGKQWEEKKIKELMNKDNQK